MFEYMTRPSERPPDLAWRCRSLRRARHHCRLCGGIFCAACSAARMLLPPKFQEGTPQRVCTNCAALLLPLQPFLAGMGS